MIERYFSQAKVLIRLRSGSVGPYLPRFVSALEQRRFSCDTIRLYIRGADSLCRWLDRQGVAVVEANQGHVERYVRQHTRAIRFANWMIPLTASIAPEVSRVSKQAKMLFQSATPHLYLHVC
jgi:hypothetical protein